MCGSVFDERRKKGRLGECREELKYREFRGSGVYRAFCGVYTGELYTVSRDVGGDSVDRHVKTRSEEAGVFYSGKQGVVKRIVEPVLMLLLMSVLLSTMISGASFIVGVKRPDSEKVSVYECGFDPFGSLKSLFSVRFFLVGILFMIFDLEISFLFPWCVVLGEIGLLGF